MFLILFTNTQNIKKAHWNSTSRGQNWSCSPIQIYFGYLSAESQQVLPRSCRVVERMSCLMRFWCTFQIGKYPSIGCSSMVSGPFSLIQNGEYIFSRSYNPMEHFVSCNLARKWVQSPYMIKWLKRTQIAQESHNFWMKWNGGLVYNIYDYVHSLRWWELVMLFLKWWFYY